MTAALREATLTVSPEALAVLEVLEDAGDYLTVGELASYLDLNERVVRRALRDLDTAGVAICTGTHGVWLGTPEEVDATIHASS
jgi:transcription initiation factor IIE alpha subunit